MTEEHVCEIEFQVNKPNGDIDFITVYDLPEKLAQRFVTDKYPDSKIEVYSPLKSLI
jgi:hypothetical protein